MVIEVTADDAYSIEQVDLVAVAGGERDGGCGLRTAPARSVCVCRNGGILAWALDSSLPRPREEQMPRPDDGLAPVVGSAGRIARRTKAACEMADAPANVMSPAHLSDRAVNFAHLVSEIADPVSAERAVGHGASGYGARMLVELATRLSVTLAG